MNILAVDPGGTTGLAWCPSEVLATGIVDDRLSSLVSLGQIAGTIPEQAIKLWKGMERTDACIVISESSDHFLLAGAGRGQHSLIPIKLNGALSAMCQLRSHAGAATAFVEQTPGQAKGVVKDNVLNALGFVWRKTNERHQIDALRHLVLFVRRYQESKKANTGFYKVFEEVLNGGEH